MDTGLTARHRGLYHVAMPSSVVTIGAKLSLVLVLLAPLAACTSRARTYCESKAACEGGNDADIDACVIGVDASEEVAAAYDCAEAFDKAAECVETAGFCDNGKYKDGCDDVDDALDACIAAASARR
jgi:hypothetical protein